MSFLGFDIDSETNSSNISGSSSSNSLSYTHADLDRSVAIRRPSHKPNAKRSRTSSSNSGTNFMYENDNPYPYQNELMEQKYQHSTTATEEPLLQPVTDGESTVVYEFGPHSQVDFSLVNDMETDDPTYCFCCLYTIDSNAHTDQINVGVVAFYKYIEQNFAEVSPLEWTTQAQQIYETQIRLYDTYTRTYGNPELKVYTKRTIYAHFTSHNPSYFIQVHSDLTTLNHIAETLRRRSIFRYEIDPLSKRRKRDEPDDVDSNAVRLYLTVLEKVSKLRAQAFAIKPSRMG